MSQDWWRHAVIYQVYVRSFADSNGDGIGDLPGIRSRLPYLRDLGVAAPWTRSSAGSTTCARWSTTRTSSASG